MENPTSMSNSQDLPDVRAFLDMLHDPPPEARGLFDPDREFFVARAPGRLDVMGGIADYSGSLVLQLPLQEATLVALQPDHRPELRIVSLGATGNDRTAGFSMSLADLERGAEPLSYAEARDYFAKDPAAQWAAYVAGAYLVLRREQGVRFEAGARLLINSRVPEGKGVSSSAALEVAAMQAIAVANDLDLPPRRLAILCQMVENLVVGAPCGVMDQMTASCGEAHALLSLLCQPAEIQGTISLPEGVAVWGIDSGVRQSVSGADYGSGRVGAFMGDRMIAARSGLRVEEAAPGDPVRITDPHWGGYLANVSPSVFAGRFAGNLPDQITGREFLREYGGTHDPVTRIDPDRTYAVRIPTAHPVYEHFRVRVFAALLQGAVDRQELEVLGELMYQSHASYSACGLGSDGTDRLVSLVRELGPARGLFGAKITGGGSGGTVAVLGLQAADQAVQEVAERYAGETGYRPLIFRGSSPGAARFGCLRLRSGRA